MNRAVDRLYMQLVDFLDGYRQVGVSEERIRELLERAWRESRAISDWSAEAIVATEWPISSPYPVVISYCFPTLNIDAKPLL